VANGLSLPITLSLSATIDNKKSVQPEAEELVVPHHGSAAIE